MFFILFSILGVATQSSNTHEPGCYMLLEEMYQSNKLPLSIERLLHHLCQRKMKSPFLIGIIYYLFLESGFVPATLPVQLKSKIRAHWGFSFVAQIPDYSWKIATVEILQQYQRLQYNEAAASIAEQIYEFKLNLLQQSDDEIQLIIQKVFNGAALCVTFCLSRQEQATSVILPVNEFVNFRANESVNFDLIQQKSTEFSPKYSKIE